MPVVEQEAGGALGRGRGRGVHYKWIALSNTTSGS